MALHLDRMTEDRLMRMFAALAAAFKDTPTTVEVFMAEPHRVRLVEDGLDKLAAALAYGFSPDAAQVEEALRRLVCFKPDVTPAQFMIAAAHPHYGADDFKRKDVKAELLSDREQEFFTEAYLYNLLGKEDARSLLGRMSALCQALGYPGYRALLPKEEEQQS